jgi:dTDP-4-amino-4,6-dideoxygalactose transaminase
MKSEWLTIGPLVNQFESKISETVGAESFVVSSGTAALHCAYAAIELMQGDEVISTPLTFVATHSTAMIFGAKIVFADIDRSTGNLDPESVERLITKKTKAISVVDYAGHPADLDRFRELADKYNLYLIEDAAHSFGAKYKGRPVGSIADLTVFSFFPTKNITTGEGGAVSSPNSDLLDRARKYGRHGLVRDESKFSLIPDGPWHQEVQSLGLNYRLPDILCALGISQIGNVMYFQKIRNEIFNHYHDLLGDVDDVELPFKENWVEPFWHLYPIRVNQNKRNQIFGNLRENNIGVQVNYALSYYHPIFRKLNYPIPSTPNAENYYRREISLPIHVNLKKRDLKKIVEILKRAILD